VKYEMVMSTRKYTTRIEPTRMGVIGVISIAEKR
jgi:hypothetical protein